MLESNSRSLRPRPSTAVLKGAGPKCHIIVAVYNLKSEIFLKSLKIHAGSDDKLQIQFALSNPQSSVLMS